MKERQGPHDSGVVELARAMLDRASVVAPEQVYAERKMFGLLCRAYFSDPERALAARERTSGSGPLNFGLPDVEELLTPVFLAAASAVVAHLADKAAAATEEMMRRLLEDSSGRQEASAVRFTGEQLREVRRIVAQTLIHRGGMTPERAELFAAAAVGDAVTGETPE
ncbi:hypothetical protein [Streptomyces sp. NBC_01262]|uniref:hypothetical protein n=1 Tax=Streptomyces sp. NBC_01262 TaxID=2903803 RepID=UPI002E3763B6|nr:hypothetical protein [Streptomyces sp. NBC_01262]